jgi:hypothetical protein
MVKTQCDQIAATQSLILEQGNFNRVVSTNIVTRRGTITKGLEGPDWYKEEQTQKEKEMQEMSQEEEDLVDPQDDAELEAWRSKQQQAYEDNADEQGEPYDSDAEIVDPREEDEPSREQEVEMIIVKKSKLKNNSSRKTLQRILNQPQR